MFMRRICASGGEYTRALVKPWILAPHLVQRIFNRGISASMYDAVKSLCTHSAADGTCQSHSRCCRPSASSIELATCVIVDIDAAFSSMFAAEVRLPIVDMRGDEEATSSRSETGGK